MVDPNWLHSKERDTRESLVCSLSAFARVSGGWDQVRLQEYDQYLRDGICRIDRLDEQAVAEPPGLKKPAPGLQEQATNCRTHVLSWFALPTQLQQCFYKNRLWKQMLDGIVTRIKKNQKTLYILEFKWSSDRNEGFLGVKEGKVCKPQKSIIKALKADAPE